LELLSIVSGDGAKIRWSSLPSRTFNGKRYADNWLENLLVCGSMNGVEQDPQNPL
jgi:hypothetical protein